MNWSALASIGLVKSSQVRASVGRDVLSYRELAERLHVRRDCH
jgi:hypothetical protein